MADTTTSAHRMTRDTRERALRAIFSGTCLLRPLDPSTDTIETVDSDVSTGTHNFIVRAGHILFRDSPHRTYLVQLRRTRVPSQRSALLEELARPLLGGLVPDRMLAGELDMPEIGCCAFVVYSLAETEDCVMPLSQAWRSMSSSQRNAVISKVMSCREKLLQVSFLSGEHSGADSHCVSSKHPLLQHPVIEDRGSGRYDELCRPTTCTESKWNKSVTTDDAAERAASRPVHFFNSHESTLALLEAYLADGAQGDVCFDTRYMRIGLADHDQYAIAVSRFHVSKIAELDFNRLQHCGLVPVNIFVRERRRVCNIPSTYELAAILGWHEAAFAPLGYDIGIQDSRLGFPGTGDWEGKFYLKFREEAAKATFHKKRMDSWGAGALKDLLAITEVLVAHKDERETPASLRDTRYNPTFQMTPRQKWLHEHHFRWEGVEKGYVKSLLRLTH